MQAAGDLDGINPDSGHSSVKSRESADGSLDDVQSTSAHQFISPVDETDGSLENRILRQIEFYFSDANILKDQFLLRSVRSNKEGWVKLSTIAAFRRVQTLTNDEDVIRRALKSSAQIEISDDGKNVYSYLVLGMRIRRKHPLPDWDKSVYSKSILITRFTEADVVTVFSSMNLDVKLVRIVDPGRVIPRDLVKSASLIGFLGKEKCAVVEFDSRESALRAIGVVKNTWPNSYCTILHLYARPQISLTSCVYSDVKVELVRDSRSPPNENSVGFETNWREALSFHRLNMEDSNENSSCSISISSDEFFTPQAPSPRAPISPSTVALSSSVAQPASQLMCFDEAIVSVIPTASSGAG
ncbi:unnamed protein product [Hydatigera taeniaeformis]|uniref:HTH La-type RNA-binding domain-containing protein n=1 Tax=Hydatigena taeniaeformis TaxID=6205 RepID=A0A0R3X646_HYDTA|nr:unnamed protein product [Hydatigera taeniaeformis]